MKLRQLKHRTLAVMLNRVYQWDRWQSLENELMHNPVNFESVKETLQVITSIAGGLPSFCAGLALGDLRSMIPNTDVTELRV